MKFALKNKQTVVRINASDVLPNWKIRLNAFAPVYFIFFSLARCYIETGLLARHSFFSYYVALHHTLWNASTILMIILLMHFILKVPIVRLVWVMYGVTLMAIPLLYALATGEHLQLEYLRGSFSEIVGYVATFCWAYTKNRPLTIELLVIFFSMITIGYAYSRSWPRAFLLAVLVYIVGNLFAINWVGPVRHSKSVFLFQTQWHHHQFMAAFWLFMLTVLLIVFVRQAEWFGRGQRSWCYAVLAAAFVWMLQAAVFKSIGWFNQPFDIIMSGLPAVTLAFIGVNLLFAKRENFFGWTFAAMSIIFILQIAVIGPIYLGHMKIHLPFLHHIVPGFGIGV
jgi:uncharacterized membrane protein (DUF441 family)